MKADFTARPPGLEIPSSQRPELSGCVSDPPPPTRRYQLTLTLGADDLQELDRGLNEISRSILYEGSRNCTSGGCGAGWHYKVAENPEMTHERYVTALQEYLAVKKQNSANSGPQGLEAVR